MKRRIIKILISSFILCILGLNIFNSFVFADENELEIVSPNAICIDSETGEVLYQKGTDDTISMASITKLMTAIVCVENIEEVNTLVTVDMNRINERLNYEFAVAGIYDGEQLTYYDLLCTTLIPSGADSALCIAYNVFGDYDTFIQKMNEKAKELGMENTHFSNPIGYDEEGNYSTTKDITKLLKYVLQNETLKQIITMDSYTTTDGNVKCSNTIQRAASVYGVSLKRIKGGKTGTTGVAGICLASFGVDEERELIAVVTGAPMYSDRPYNIIDTEMILEYVSQKYNYLNIMETGQEILSLNTKYCKEENVKFKLDKSIPKYLDKVDNEKIRVEYVGKESLNSLIQPGSVIGKVTIYYDEEVVYEQDIVLAEKLNFSIRKFINKHYLEMIFVIFLILAIGFLRQDSKRNRKKKKNKNKK